MAMIVNGRGYVGIGRSNPVRPTLLLDSYSGSAVAYSLRKLSLTYSGSAIRVRRSNDSQTQDIGFDASGNLDTSALTSFVGANNGFVTIWYDQSGNGRDVSQSTATNQPQIVSGGTILTINGKPSIKFDGVNDYLFKTTSFNATKLWVSMVYKAEASLNPFQFSPFVDTTMNSLSTFTLSGFRVEQYPNSTLTTTIKNGVGNQEQNINIGVNNYNLLSFGNNGNGFGVSTQISAVNGTIYNTETNKNNPSIISTNYTLIGRQDVYYAKGFIQELITYPIYQGTNRISIESNINTYYTIY